MDSNGVFSFLKILEEAIQLLPKNGKLMALLALSTLLISVITFVAFGLSILALTQDMAAAAKSLVPDSSSFNPSDPASLDPSKIQDLLNHMKLILVILYAVEIAFVFVFYVISFATTMAIVLTAAVSRVGNTVSVKYLFSRMARTWKKPFLTCIYVTFHAFGFLVITGLFAAPAVMYPNIITILMAILVVILASLFYLYLVVIWALAIVVSVVEDGCYGLVAMGKASELIEGQRLKGYFLNVFFFLVSSILLVIYYVILWVKGPTSAMIYGLFIMGFSYLVRILQLVAYTVLYFHCKKQHRETPEIDIGFVKYELLPTTHP